MYSKVRIEISSAQALRYLCICYYYYFVLKMIKLPPNSVQLFQDVPLKIFVLGKSDRLTLS